ncbi:MAG: metal-dependent hydrolase [Desulfovibrionaceae bacterium]|nr:metal-dependent hydrolase [Desulfovibrionaceae bacterium]
MDSLTHLVAGALMPLAFKRTPKRAAVIGFGIAVGELPDIDAFFGAGTEALLVFHRGVTHALFWQPVLTLLAVIPFYIWLQCRRAGTYPLPAPDCRTGDPCPAFFAGDQGMGAFSFGRMYLVALIGVVIHLYFDWMTTFGTMIFLPFSPMRVALPALFIVDPFLTLPLLVLFILALKAPPDIIPAKKGDSTGFAFVSARSQKLARIGLAWILLYPLLSLGVNATLTARLTPSFTAPEAPSRLILMTEPFSPFVWKAIVDDGPAYRMSVLFPLDHLDPPGREKELIFSKPDPQLYDALMRQNPLFGQFRDFSPLMVQLQRPVDPMVQLDYKEPVSEYAFVDLRYIISPDSPARWFGRTEPIFMLEARVNPSGALLSYRFLQRGHDEHTPWTTVE